MDGNRFLELRKTLSSSGPLCLAAVLALGIIACAGTVGAGSWEGTEKIRDGVPVVLNPTNPIESPITLSPKELWQIAGDEEEEYFFGVLIQVASDSDGNLYLLDSQLNQVMVFSPEGEYLRAIGREGEGPGEFQRPSDLFVTGDGNIAVLQRMPGKIVVLTPEGEPLGNYPVPEPDDGGMQMLSGGRLAGDHVVLNVNQFARRETGFDTIASLIAVDDEGNLTATYFTRRDARDFANMVFDEKKMMGALVWNVGMNGSVFTSDDFDAYRIQVWNPDGTVERVIEREYAHRERSEKEIKRSTPVVRLRRGNQSQSPDVKGSKTDRDVQQIFPRGNGDLWVLSSRGAFDVAPGVIATFDVYDKNGKFTRQLTFNGKGSYAEDGLHIVNDRLYVVTGLRSARRAQIGEGEGSEDDADDEPMGVICYDLTSLLVQTGK